MPPLTRRRALLAAASSVVPLAGCAGGDERPTIERSDYERAIDDYDVRRTRNEDGEVLFAEGETLPTPIDDRPERYAAGRTVVVSEDDLAELTFGTVPEAEQLRSFARATDFDTSSLYLLSTAVEACHEIRLQSVSVERGELVDDDLHPSADFCETYRPADVDCDVGVVHTAGFAIRLPVAAERSTGSGRGMSSSCDQPSGGESFEATVTPADGGEGE